MYVERTSKQGEPSQFAIQGLTDLEISIIQSGLLEIKEHSFADDTFRNERKICADMFRKIDDELIRT